MMKKILILLFIPLFGLTAGESSWSGQGEIGFEYRRFESDANSQNADTGVAVLSRVESSFETDVYKHVFRGFGRVDQKDNDRSLVVIEDGYLSMFLGADQSWKVLAGYKIFNWSATEAFHPADQINSRNYDSNVESLEKKGELTIELEKTLEEGSFALYFFPRFEEPVFPGSRSRLGLGVDLQRVLWIDRGDATSDQNFGLQFGARFSTAIGDADLSFHFLHHMDRSFPVIGTHRYTTAAGNIVPLAIPNTPYFYRVNQIGFTATLPYESLIFKLEAATRKFDNELSIYTARGLRKSEDNTEVAFGTEYSFAHSSGAESFIYLEGQMMFGPAQSRIQEMAIFQKDIFTGYRYAFNDIMGKEIFVSLISDVQRSREFLYNFNYSQRLSDLWKIKTGLRIYDAPKKEATARGLEFYDGNSYVFTTLTRYF